MTRVILLMGPTASGKSALALEIAEAIGAEIVSVDSAQVFRGMDIGTAKPTAAERARVRHHLIDLRDPEESWSAAEFAAAAGPLIDAIAGRGRVPLLVGGTMLYFRALLQGLDAIPPVDPSLRSALRERLQETGAAALHRELVQVDAVAGARIHPNDPQRILRALEVYHGTGRPLSSFQSGESRRPPPGWISLALWPDDRSRLRQRIADRFERMLEAGFAAELERLAARPGLTAAHASQRAVGYRQGWQWLSGDCGFDEFRRRTITATRQLAKRQLTWLRGLEGVERLPAEFTRAEHVLRRLSSGQE